MNQTGSDPHRKLNSDNSANNRTTGLAKREYGFLTYVWIWMPFNLKTIQTITTRENAY